MWVWPKAREREAGKQGSREVELEEGERERKNGRKKKHVGPVTVINMGTTHEFNSDLNPDWIQKHVKG